MNKEELKKLLELDEPIFVNKFAALLQPHAKMIYLIGLVCLAISVFGALITLLTGGISVAIISLFISCVVFVLLRMGCEFLISYNK